MHFICISLCVSVLAISRLAVSFLKLSVLLAMEQSMMKAVVQILTVFYAALESYF